MGSLGGGGLPFTFGMRHLGLWEAATRPAALFRPPPLSSLEWTANFFDCLAILLQELNNPQLQAEGFGLLRKPVRLTPTKASYRLKARGLLPLERH